MKMLRLAAVAALLFATAPALAQWQTPNHSVPIGKGGGVQSFGSAVPGAAGQPFVSTGPSSDPAFGNIANGGFAAGAANTVKGSLNGTTVTDIPVPDCQAANTAIRYAAGSGPLCGNVVVQTGFDAPVNLGLSSSAVGGALTINVTQASGAAPSASAPVLVPFRSTTLSSGAVTWGTISSALSLTIPNGASLGTSSNAPFRVWIFLNANGGTPAIGVATCSNTSAIFPCTSWEYTLKTPVALNTSSTNGGVLYTPGGVVLDAVRIVGYCEYPAGLATAGTWSGACTAMQVVGPGVKKPGDVVQTAYAANNALTITPTSAANRVKFTGTYNCNAPLGAAAVLNYFRGSNNILAQSLNGSAAASLFSTSAATLFDSPNSTSATLYQIFNSGASCGSALSNMLLEEIMG